MHARPIFIIYFIAGWLLLISASAMGAVITVNPAQGDTIEGALAEAVSGDEILLLPGIYVGPGNRNLVVGNDIESLTIRSDSHPEYCTIDAETRASILASQGVDLTVSGIRFKSGNGESGSGLYCSGGNLTVENCEFVNNISSGNGGAICLLNMIQTRFTNCLFSGNSGGAGGAIFMNFTGTTILEHCTLNGNVAQDSAAIHSQHSSVLDISYSILWDNSNQAIINEAGSLNLNYCDLDQSVGGENNINANPLFEYSSFGDHYLASEDAGFATDSPCINAFAELRVEDFPAIIGLTTSVYQHLDEDLLDLGYHYSPDTAFATPTQTATPTITPTPTQTPTDTPTATPGPSFQVDLMLSESIFEVGDDFELKIQFSNTQERENPLRLYVVLDVFGELFFAPEWSLEDQFQYISLGIGLSGFTVLNFTWPDVDGSVDHLTFYAGVLDTQGLELIADPRFPDLAMSSVMFGYR